MMINSKLPTKIKYKTRMFSLTITFHYCTGSPTKYSRTRKTSKGTQTGKEKNKTVFAPRRYGHLHRKSKGIDKGTPETNK